MTEDNKQDTSFPSGGSRTEYIGAKVTVEQKQYIRRLAAECGMTVSSYVLARAFNYRPKARLTARQELSCGLTCKVCNIDLMKVSLFLSRHPVTVALFR